METSGAYISPGLVNSLPIEVLSNVFILGHQSLPLHGDDAHQFLISLNATCQWWRAIALAFPSLWTSITIRWAPYHSTLHLPQKHLSPTMALFLERSKDSSLDFLLITNGPSDESRSRVVLETIRPHIQRCRSIRAKFVQESIARLLLPLPGEMPRLRELKLSWVDAGPMSQGPMLSIVETSNRSPLTVLHLLGHRYVDVNGISSTTISDLIFGAEVHDKVKLLEQCAESLKYYASMNPVTGASHTINLPNLTQLCVTRLALLRPSLSTTISCSRLQELLLFPTAALRFPIIRQPLAPLPYEHLHTLTIPNWSGPTEWANILSAFPHVVTLRYTTRGEFLKLINCLANEAEALPKLALFCWALDTPVLPADANDGDFQNLLENRPQLRFEWGRSTTSPAGPVAFFNPSTFRFPGRVTKGTDFIRQNNIFEHFE